MNISQNSSTNHNLISHYDNKSITIANKIFKTSFYASKETTGELNLKDINNISLNDLEMILTTKPEVVIFGTGSKMQKLSPNIYEALINKKINFEYMNTISAIKTYNALCFDERNALGVFIIDNI